MPKINSKALAFNLPDQDGQMHKLGDYQGKWLLIYFYPKDDTSGCTKEACMIRDDLPNFRKLKCEVVGISADSVESHKKFADKYGLPFTLLSDENKKVINKYGVWVEKSMYGKKYWGIPRTSFLVNPKGKIVKIYEKVNPAVHSEEVLADLNNFSAD